VNLSDISNSSASGLKGFELITLTSDTTLDVSDNNIFEINSNDKYTISISNDDWTGQEIIIFNNSNFLIRLILNDVSNDYCFIKPNNTYRILSLKNNNVDELVCIQDQSEVPIYDMYRETYKLFNNAIADARAGGSCAMSADGNTAIVGAYSDSSSTGNAAGIVQIFVRSGTTWIHQQSLVSSDLEDGDTFGGDCSISDDGNTCIVGAPHEDTGSSNAGAAYIFTRSGSTWNQQQKIQASNKGGTDYFGTSCSLSGDGNTCIVGATNEDTGASNAGAVYIFTRTGSAWTEQQMIMASDKAEDDYFGKSCSLSGDGNTCIVGAWLEDTGGSNAGAAYIFTKSGSVWTEQQKIQASDKSANNRFSFSCSISGDGNVCVVGSPESNQCYIFTRTGTTWTESQKINELASGDFGYSCSMSTEGNTFIVGDKLNKIYIFNKNAIENRWIEQKVIPCGHYEDSVDFGYSCSISGDGNVYLVGDPRFTRTSLTYCGSFYIFENII